MSVEWETSTIESLTAVVGRGKSPIYAERGGRPGLNQACIQWEGLDLTRTKQVTDRHFEHLSPEKVAQRGDVLLNSTGTGTLGRVGYWDTPEPISFDSHVTLLRVKNEHVGKFLYYWLGTHEAQRLIDIYCVTGSTNQIELARNPLLDVKVRHPKQRRAQEAIVECIDALQGEIEATERVIAKQERVRAGLLQALLTRGIDENGEIRTTDNLELLVDGGWRFLPLSAMYSRRTKVMQASNPLFRDQILIAPDHIESGTARLLSLRTAMEQGAQSAKFEFRTGDVLYSKIRPYLKKACIAPVNGISSTDILPLQPSTITNATFLLELLMSFEFTKYAVGCSERSTFPRINSSQLGEFRALIPSPQEQLRIAEAIQDFDSAARDRLAILQKLHGLKTGLIRDLLSGEVSVEPLLDLPPFPSEKIETP